VDASFGNGDGLLFHGLVNGYLIFDFHLVELVDATDSMVGQHEGTRLNAILARLTIFTHRCGQTSGT
jgi:hypothetical protein